MRDRWKAAIGRRSRCDLRRGGDAKTPEVDEGATAFWRYHSLQHGQKVSIYGLRTFLQRVSNGMEEGVGHQVLRLVYVAKVAMEVLRGDCEVNAAAHGISNGLPHTVPVHFSDV